MSDQWPAWATAKVEIHDWDPAWPRRADELVRRLTPLLDRWLAGQIEHVGSTAVPGLASKPVIDLMAPVTSLTESSQADGVLADAGWELVPPDLDQGWRRLHVLAAGDRRLAHLHLVEVDHPRWRESLAFRDALRQQPELAAAYERVKRAAARAHEDDREAYTAAKAPFITAWQRAP